MHHQAPGTAPWGAGSRASPGQDSMLSSANTLPNPCAALACASAQPKVKMPQEQSLPMIPDWSS